jgi:hypothetical protein
MGDFTLGLTPSSGIVISPGGQQTFTVSVSGNNGFSGQVSITIAGASTGITLSTTQFSLTAGNQQNVSVSASNAAAVAATTLSLTGTAGGISHNARLSLVVEKPVASPHPPGRSRFLRTDATFNPDSFLTFPPRFTTYDPAHKRFFISNTILSRVEVFDAATEQQIGSIKVPQVWGIDVLPNGTKLYAATVFGDIYVIDPGVMQVIQRIPSTTIGPNGYMATQVVALADGRLGLMGGLGAIFIDESPSFGVWNPTNNDLVVNSSSKVAAISCSTDRTKLLVDIGVN